jgi:hypothetical protein
MLPQFEVVLERPDTRLDLKAAKRALPGAEPACQVEHLRRRAFGRIGEDLDGGAGDSADDPVVEAVHLGVAAAEPGQLHGRLAQTPTSAWARANT